MNATSSLVWMQSFAVAREFWEAVITGDLGLNHNSSGLNTGDKNIATRYPSTIDDVYIGGVETYIDGPGKVLGQAGPKHLRTDDGGKTYQTLTGFMEFDSEDIARHLGGNFDRIVKHEMGHVLGIGTLWKRNNLYTNGTRYNGPKAQAQWAAMGCNAESDYLPVETGGAHFDEACLQSELMTPWFNAGAKFSKLSIGTMEDMGYKVSYAPADPFGTCDLSSNSNCTKACAKAGQPCSNRYLRGESRQKPKERAQLSEESRAAAVKYGREGLKRNKKSGTLSLPSNPNVIFADSVTVLYEQGGEIYGVFVNEEDDGSFSSIII